MDCNVERVGESMGEERERVISGWKVGGGDAVRVKMKGEIKRCKKIIWMVDI